MQCFRRFHHVTVTACHAHMYFFLTVIPTERLEEVVSDRDIEEIAREHLTDWESLRPYLGLTRQQKVDIRKSYPGDYEMQKWECLQTWRRNMGDNATYIALIRAALKVEDEKLADGVRAMLINACKDPHSK